MVGKLVLWFLVKLWGSVDLWIRNREILGKKIKLFN